MQTFAQEVPPFLRSFLSASLAMVLVRALHSFMSALLIFSTIGSEAACRRVTFYAIIVLWILSGLCELVHESIIKPTDASVPSVFFCALCLSLMAFFLRPSPIAVPASPSIREANPVKRNTWQMRSRFTFTSTVAPTSPPPSGSLNRTVGPTNFLNTQKPRTQVGASRGKSTCLLDYYHVRPGADAPKSPLSINSVSGWPASQDTQPPSPAADRVPSSSWSQFSPRSTSRLLRQSVPDDIPSGTYADVTVPPAESPTSVYSNDTQPPGTRHQPNQRLPLYPKRVFTPESAATQPPNHYSTPIVERLGYLMPAHTLDRPPTLPNNGPPNLALGKPANASSGGESGGTLSRQASQKSNVSRRHMNMPLPPIPQRSRLGPFPEPVRPLYLPRPLEINEHGVNAPGMVTARNFKDGRGIRSRPVADPRW